MTLCPALAAGQASTSPYVFAFGAGAGSLDYEGTKTVISPQVLLYRTPFTWGGVGLRGGFDFFREAIDDRYELIGLEICYDPETQRTVSVSNCDPPILFVKSFLEAEAIARVFESVFVVAGVRTYSVTIPYAGVRFVASDLLALSLQAGPSLFTVSLSLEAIQLPP
jgi:hypothetical protein